MQAEHQYSMMGVQIIRFSVSSRKSAARVLLCIRVIPGHASAARPDRSPRLRHRAVYRTPLRII